MRPPSAGLCCHPVQRNAATFGNHQRVRKSHPRRRRGVGLGRCAVCRHPCKSLSIEKRRFPGRACESAHCNDSGFTARKYASRLMVPALAEPDIHLLPQAPKSYRRRLSLCSLPVPKQSEGSLGSVISSAQSANGGTWQSAHGSSCFLRRQCLCCPSLSFFCRHEISLLPIYGEQIGHHLAGYGEGGPVAVSFLPFFS